MNIYFQTRRDSKCTMTSEIQNFFAQESIFITGGTGILGKILIEKLLRDCWNLKKLYILIRPKRNRTAEQRFREFFDNPCFDLIKSKNLTRKVCLVNGDCKAPNLGISPRDTKILIEETTCVIHAAANVSFNQTLREASYIIKATRDVLNLANQMQNLKEKFYHPPIDADTLFALVDNLDDDILTSITPRLLGEWPNTYVYAKCVSENLLKVTRKRFPIALVRPGVVINASQEPFPGWIDKMYNVVAITTGASLGTLRCCFARSDYSTQVVPVDFVSNCVLAAAWRTAREEPHATVIYNYSGLKNRPITHEQLSKYIWAYYWKTASTKAAWYGIFKTTRSRFWFNVRVFFLHTLVAYLIDFVLYCSRKPTIAVKKYRAINQGLDSLGYFATRQWQYHDNNVEKLWDEMGAKDRQLFNFNMKNFDWDVYFHNYFFGIRRYVLDDPKETLQKGQRKLVLLMIIHYTAVTLFCISIFTTIRGLF